APAAASFALPPNSANAPSSIANARAEWPLPPSRVGPDAGVFTAPRPLATVAGTISPDSEQRGDDTTAQRSVVASRWGELAGSSAPASPGLSTDHSTPANSATAPAPAKAAPPAAGLPLAAADTS